MLRPYGNDLTEKDAAKKGGLFGLADGGAAIQRVIALRFDGVENCDAAAAKHFEIDAEFALDLLRQRKTFIKQDTSAANQIFHQDDVIFAKSAGNDVGFADTVLRGHVQRNVDAAFFQVAADVLPEIGQFQRGTRRVRKLLARLISVPAKIKHQPADGIRGIDAVVENRIPGGITLDGLVLTKSFQ